MRSEVKLSPPDVDRAINLLKQFSGDDEENHVLEDIKWLERKCYTTISRTLKLLMLLL